MGVGLLMLPVGFYVLGMGTLRAGVFTGWRRTVPLGFGLMLALVVSALMLAYWTDSRNGYEIVISRLPPSLTVFGFAIGWAAFGYTLWSGKTESRENSPNHTSPQ